MFNLGFDHVPLRACKLTLECVIHPGNFQGSSRLVGLAWMSLENLLGLERNPLKHQRQRYTSKHYMVVHVLLRMTTLAQSKKVAIIKFCVPELTNIVSGKSWPHRFVIDSSQWSPSRLWPNLGPHLAEEWQSSGPTYIWNIFTFLFGRCNVTSTKYIDLSHPFGDMHYNTLLRTCYSNNARESSKNMSPIEFVLNLSQVGLDW